MTNITAVKLKLAKYRLPARNSHAPTFRYLMTGLSCLIQTSGD